MGGGKDDRIKSELLFGSGGYFGRRRAGVVYDRGRKVSF